MLDYLKNLISPDPIKVKAAGLTDIGRVRENNEDCFFIDGEKKLYVVADGMGGHNAGEIASRTTVEILRRHFSNNTIASMNKNPHETRNAMLNSFEIVNDTVMDLAENDPELQGMGCTLVLSFVSGTTLHTCHVGDARCYVLSGGKLSQVTNDHTTLVEMKEAAGDDKDFSETTHNRHVVTRVIGYPFPEPPEYNSTAINEGDRVLLCSDGLWSMIDEEQIIRSLTDFPTPEEAVENMVEKANEAGGNDNITALAVFC